MLIPVTVPVAQLPPGSQDGAEVAVWFAPSVDRVVGGGVVGVPDDGAGSVLVQVIVTGALYHPLALGEVSGVPVTTGGWSSTMTWPVISLKMMYACRVPVIAFNVKGMMRPLLRTTLGLLRVTPLGTMTVAMPLELRGTPLAEV